MITNKIVKVDLTDKVALIIGVVNDTGKDIVEKLAECSANVGMMDSDIDELIKMEAEINARSGGSVFAIQGDIFSSGGVANAVWQTSRFLERFIGYFQNYLFALQELRSILNINIKPEIMADRRAIQMLLKSKNEKVFNSSTNIYCISPN